MEFVILWILCGVVAAMIAAKKGVARAGFYAGLFLGPIGILIAIFSKGDRKSCSYCNQRELVRSCAYPFSQRASCFLLKRTLRPSLA